MERERERERERDRQTDRQPQRDHGDHIINKRHNNNYNDDNDRNIKSDVKKDKYDNNIVKNINSASFTVLTTLLHFNSSPIITTHLFSDS